MTEPANGADGAMLREVREGLSKSPKELSPKFFYDERGSELFERITALPEYYLSRSERELLSRWMPEWIAEVRPRTLIELGAGSAAKTRTILDAMTQTGSAERYVPLDVSAKFLASATADLRRDYPALEVQPVVADITADLALPAGLPRPALFAFLGSTIGNFAREQAVALLARARAAMQPDDRFLMGVDLKKDASVLEAAYNDAEGVTADFNLNMLRVLNQRLGATFDLAAWRHRAFYNAECGCIEMHLVPDQPQTVEIPGAGSFEVAGGESIRTELSCKHDREGVARMLASAGMRITRWETDSRGWYAILLGAPA